MFINHIPLTENYQLVSYNPEVNIDQLKNLNIDVIKYFNLYSPNSFESTDKYNKVSIAISAAVTAYARIHINELKFKILNLGGILYYSDTDSIVTNIKLSDDMIGSEIGKLKLE